MTSSATTNSTTTWTEIAIEVPAEAAELVASEVAELTGGVEVRDAGTLLRAGEGRALIVTQCAPADAAAVLAAVEDTCVRAREGGLRIDPVSVRQREAHEDEWRDVWKQYFRATRVGRTVLVRPSWDLRPAAEGDRIIDIDPGRAFGTGGHASTRLVIGLCEEIADRRVARFLDLGCGSGILSMVAAQLWPSARGLAVDIDPEAVATTVENLERNRITTVDTRVGVLGDVAEVSDLVLANIEAGVLAPLAVDFPARVVPGGTVVLSGLLAEQAEGVIAAFVAAGFALESRRDEDEWAALSLRR
jgi:ribosomal protein L11 methyltransferase